MAAQVEMIRELARVHAVDIVRYFYGEPNRRYADLTRWMRKPPSFDSIRDALEVAAQLYCRDLWRDADCIVEVWFDKNALAGVVYPVTAGYDVPLMSYRGFSSETFAYEAVQNHAGETRPLVILHIGDFDRAGEDARTDLERKLCGFAAEVDLAVNFIHLGVTIEQIVSWRLPRRPPKRNTPADRRWPHDFAVELDAIPPDDLREIVRAGIEQFLPRQQFEVLKAAEESERKLISRLVTGAIR